MAASAARLDFSAQAGDRRETARRMDLANREATNSAPTQCQATHQATANVEKAYECGEWAVATANFAAPTNVRCRSDTSV